MQDIIDAIACDPALGRLVKFIVESKRMRAGAFSLAEKVIKLDALERAGLDVNNATALVVFDGGQVTSVAEAGDGLQIRGGGFVPLPRKKTGVS